MGFNFLEMMSKYNQFKKLYGNCSQQELLRMLEDEMKKRNISQSQLSDLLKNADTLKKMLGL